MSRASMTLLHRQPQQASPSVTIILCLLGIATTATVVNAISVTVTSPSPPTPLYDEPTGNRRAGGDPYQAGLRVAGETQPMYPDPAFTYGPSASIYCQGVVNPPAQTAASFCTPETPAHIEVPTGTVFNMRGAAFPPIDPNWKTVSETTGFANPGPSAPFYYDIQNEGANPATVGNLRYNDVHPPPTPNPPLGYRDILKTLGDQGSNTIRVNVDYTAWPNAAFTQFLNVADSYGLKVIPMLYWDPSTDFTQNTQRCNIRVNFRNMVNAVHAHPAVMGYGAMAFLETPQNWTHPTATFPDLQVLVREMAWEARTQDTGHRKPVFTTMSHGYEWITQIRLQAGLYYADEYTMRVFDASVQGQLWNYNLNGLQMTISSQPPRLKVWDLPRMSHVQALGAAPAGGMIACP
eukprot:TRINITY_DN15428_c0_g1_i1.p1 TRINITY_DN15428_c0_g1~~TRINITY_DN15428_c0_g1_i1.p1  ORF type:complete len:406 (+),score=68.58 TRINITY_DN15428_c0_g1_i1:361-1578(+)